MIEFFFSILNHSFAILKKKRFFFPYIFLQNILLSFQSMNRNSSFQNFEINGHD